VSTTRSIFGFFAVALSLCAQATNLRVVSVTAQQAVVEYDTPDTSACTLAVTDSSPLHVTVWDVSSAKFVNANTDLGRPDTTVWNNGLTREVILGARTAQAGADGKLYSRSLQANTAHTLTVTCTGAPVSINFTTLNPPVGATYPDPQSFDPAGVGNAAWPTIDWTAPNAVYIDPKTGISLRPATWWGRYGFTATGNHFASVWDPAGSWSSRANVLTGSQSTLASASTTDPIYVSLNSAIPTVSGTALAGGFSGYTISDLRLTIQGNGSASAAAHRQVNVCLYSHNSGNCDTPVQTVTLSSSGTTTIQFPGSGWPSAPFNGWGTKTWIHNLVAPFSATVNVSGSAVTSTASVPYDGANSKLFNTDLQAGDKVLINGILATIQTVTSPTTMTIQENLGTLTGATLTAANFGVKIAKATGTGIVNLSVSYDLAYESTPGFFISDGASSQCSANTFNVTETASGATQTPVPGRLCIFRGATGVENSVHVLIPSTGEMREVGIIKIGYTGDCTDCYALTLAPRIPYDPFETSDPRTFYVMGYSSGSRWQVIKIVYRGSGKSYGPQYVPVNNYAMWTPTDGESTCRSGETQSGNMCLSWVTQPSVHDLNTIASAADSRIAAGVFGTGAQPIQVLNGKLILYWNLQQDAATAFTYLDLATSAITWVSDTFSTPGARWGAMHTASAWTAGGTWHAAAINPLGRSGNTGAMVGPYSSRVTYIWNSTDGVNGTWNANTALDSTYNYPCPASICGTTVANMIRFRIAGTPCSAYPSAAEKALYPCPWNSNYSALSTIQAGDLAGNCDPTGCRNSELMQVLRVVQTSSTDWDIWAQRGKSSPSQPQQASSNGWSITMFPSNSCDSALFWYDVSGQDRTAHADDCSVISGAHVDIVSGPGPGTYTFTKSTWDKYGVPATSGGFGQQVQNNLNGFGTWNQLIGNTNFPGNGNIELYPSLRHFFAAPLSERVWAADYRAILGGTFTANNGGTQSISGNTLTRITTGRTKVWKFVSQYPVLPKQLPMEAFAGRWYFKDMSGPGSNITDASLYSYCVVYRSGECLSGVSTTPGEVYFAAPSVVNLNDGSCWTNQFDSQIPCFVPASPIGNWALQWDISQPDPSGYRFRRLSQAFAGSSRVTTAPNWRPSPEGKWGFLPTSFADGVAPMMWIMTVPPWPGFDGVRRDNYIYRSIKLGPGAGLAEIRFGYEENGPAASFYCTSRQEACVSRRDGSLFNFVTTDQHSATSCGSGCTISVPAISGRILWWQEFRSADSGVTWTAQGQLQPLSIP
jgi:hypothetical protein